MNKRGQTFLWQLNVWILIFSFVSIIYITYAILNFAIINDYLLYNLQDISESLEVQGVVGTGFSNITQSFGNSYTSFNFHWDDLWFIAYWIFLISTLIAAYQSRQMNYFGFLPFLFYGIMFVLFLLTLFTTLTDWWKTEIMLALFPDIIIYLPKFYFYLDNIGIFSAVHIVLCLLVNLIDFDFGKIINRRKQEQQALQEDDEVV